jgi:hypothetical protein
MKYRPDGEIKQSFLVLKRLMVVAPKQGVAVSFKAVQNAVAPVVDQGLDMMEAQRSFPVKALNFLMDHRCPEKITHNFNNLLFSSLVCRSAEGLAHIKKNIIFPVTLSTNQHPIDQDL